MSPTPNGLQRRSSSHHPMDPTKGLVRWSACYSWINGSYLVRIVCLYTDRDCNSSFLVQPQFSLSSRNSCLLKSISSL
ncbi:1-phosphatidylinositol-3-phosphate 5-kinase FAB1B [Iris pallida]|uniref:1-phosphatidylinositol-3-phosphate 5-kinase FAB1B n=1 Tax=Iris pallida TaxID=29817 RepID=A0AAX6G2G8_IRIPA|nr:1-phosphatidylinositol-3-phosphate 5-kinase FAB1B [Iris pallida]